MPELDYIFVDLEMEELAEFLLVNGFAFVPNLHYEQPAPAELNSLGEILKHTQNTRSWFLKHSAYTKVPLEMSPLKGKLDGLYWVEQRSGGPTIALAWSGIRFYQGIQFVRMGNIGHYPSFWNYESGEMEKAPDAQRQAYQEIVRYIKKRSVVSETVGRRRAWIGKRAVAEWSRGLQLGWEGFIVRPKVSRKRKKND